MKGNEYNTNDRWSRSQHYNYEFGYNNNYSYENDENINVNNINATTHNNNKKIRMTNNDMYNENIHNNNNNNNNNNNHNNHNNMNNTTHPDPPRVVALQRARALGVDLHVDRDGGVNRRIFFENFCATTGEPLTARELKKINFVNNRKKRNRDASFERSQTPRPCELFRRNKCNLGNNCTFSHDERILENYTMPECRFLSVGRCKRESVCIYHHCPTMPTAAPCRYYHFFGSCKNLTTCPYTHAILSEDAQMLFVRQNTRFLSGVITQTRNTHTHTHTHIHTHTSTNTQAYEVMWWWDKYLTALKMEEEDMRVHPSTHTHTHTHTHTQRVIGSSWL
eukprot:GHVR01168055.1.p1 GENE.GHVR01168055.1~~GHVR01168055.1.p1  ORF type:complete len:336 (+),score=141.83 GHVR01168055.1:84-1091(+)